MTPPARTYTIRVEGHLDAHWSARLGGLVITHDRAGTSTLTGPLADMAQVHGVLCGLRDIGAVLIDLRTGDHGAPATARAVGADPGSAAAAPEGQPPA